MPAPTNPKKRALMPSTRLRKALRAAGHHLSPVVQVGKEGVTEAVLRQLDEALLVVNREKRPLDRKQDDLLVADDVERFAGQRMPPASTTTSWSGLRASSTRGSPPPAESQM